MDVSIENGLKFRCEFFEWFFQISLISQKAFLYEACLTKLMKKGFLENVGEN